MVTLTLMTIYGICFLYGFALTELKLHSQRVQGYALNQQKNFNTYEDRKPLIYGNMFGLMVFVAIVFPPFEFVFSLSPDFTWLGLFLEAIFIMLVDDLWFYIYHRTLHNNKYLFRKIHAIHHRVRNTMPLDYIYEHPLEWIVGTLGIGVACGVLYACFGAVNAYSLFLYVIFRILHEINIHSGLKSWIGSHRLFAWLGASEDHAGHHLKFRGNYASTLKWCDYLFKTRLPS